MKTKGEKTFFAVMLILCMLIPMATGYAVDATEGVGFSVRAVLPENQVNSQVSYFDLHMAPERKQDLTVEIYNKEAKEIKAKISVVSASTNGNGIIDYKTPGIKDKTLKIPFSEIAKVQEEIVMVPAEKTAHTVISVTMPKEEYDGVVLGGIVVTQIKDEEEAKKDEMQAAQGVTIRNEYSYVLGVKLTETDSEVLPEFEPVIAQPELIQYRVGVVHYIRNKEAAIAKNVTLGIKIYSERENKIILTEPEKRIDMAPNSVIPYGVLWGRDIAPGNYISYVSMEQDGRTWNFEMPFEVTAQQSLEISQNSLEEKQGIPWWAVLLIILVIILIIIILILLLIVKRKKGKETLTSVNDTRMGRRK